MINYIIDKLYMYKDNLTEFTEDEVDLMIEALEYYKEPIIA